MWLTHGLSDQAPYHLVATNGAFARSEPVGTALGQDLGDILEDLSRRGPLGLFRLWRERWRYRKELARLLIVGRYMINDVGLTLDQALAEIDLPFWRR